MTITEPRPTPTEWITISEACRLVHVTRRTIYNWMDNGKLPFVRLPSDCRRIDASLLVKPAR